MYTEIYIVVLILIYITLARVTYVIGQVIYDCRKKERKRKENDKVKTLIVIGSGGHTSEMLILVQHLNPDRYSPRTYIMSETDRWSEQRVKMTEDNIVSHETVRENLYDIIKIPRSREVHQSYWTSIFSTLDSTFHSISVLLKVRPELVVCNGPGTCVPICVVAFFMRVIFLSNNRILFIESVCRVKTLSLTGKILLFIADEILVQWPDLIEVCPRAKYIDKIILVSFIFHFDFLNKPSLYYEYKGNIENGGVHSEIVSLVNTPNSSVIRCDRHCISFSTDNTTTTKCSKRSANEGVINEIETILNFVITHF